MNVKHGLYINHLVARPRQNGGLTIFTAIFVLILMTLMLFYATRVGLFEQRVSSNDARQKLAFQAAEAGLDYAVEYFMALNMRILSGSAQAAPDGAGNDPVTYRPGWLSAGNERWANCPADPDDDHPCGGAIRHNLTDPDDIDSVDADSYYYDEDGITDTTGPYASLPLDANLLDNLPVGTEVRVTAVICRRKLNDPACLSDAEVLPDETVKFSIALLSYGYSDCNDDDASGSIDIADECRGNASVTIPFGSIQNFNGSPSVPLVSKNTLPVTGTADVVPNPDGGGEGVPLSIWANSRTSLCEPLGSDGAPGDTIEVGGNFTTCEMHEWYAIDAMPADAKCPFGPGQCSCSIVDNETISYRQAGDEVIGIDVISDAVFPCDLFEFYFGVPSIQYQSIKANATVIDDCSILTEESTGFYWFSGDTCTLDDVGSINNPVVLVSAADEKTTINGNTEYFGILYLANVEDAEGDAYFKPGGGATVYGAVIVDVLFPESNLGGTFKIIYNEAGVLNAGGVGALGGLAGGWRDFGMPDIDWE